ncbi:NADH-quinone oxidoreductase subunit NuoG [Alphaproteobacteria bacterium]|nr:NADH-quinone oxidoreductase subunit NuoG [Alphaproteobacteria bacterium]
MPKLTVNDVEVEVEDGSTVLHACEAAGVEIPRFCYHDRLSIAGNCRMCLVDMERAPKPIASCAMPAGDGMVIRTDTDRVKKAREGVMEFLLINHPLDCPICDQGGECDLQDQAMGYGLDGSRFSENKRAVDNKHMGPLISTVMTRCIHCTRCVRFATEVAGVPELGAIGRGESMEITTYLEKTLASELSANVIDLCPVGALTSRPYAFAARPWELNKVETIDVMDALGSNIRVDARGAQVMRVLPRLNEDINEEWISDKTRYATDGLRRQRLDKPYARGRDGRLHPVSWDEALKSLATALRKAKPNAIGTIAGNQADAESLYALKSLMTRLGSPNLDCRQDGAKIGGNRAGYLFNSTIAGIDDADALLIIGSNPRIEAAVLNARIRRNWLSSRMPVAVVGPKVDLTYDAFFLGQDPAILDALADGSHKFAAKLKKAKRPMIIIGMGALARADGAAMLGKARQIAESYGVVTKQWNGFNVLHNAAARVGGLDLGFVPARGGMDIAAMGKAAKASKLDLLWLLGADEIDFEPFASSFVVYQGHHGDAGAHHADLVLPGAAYTEKDGIYVNTEGRVQYATRAAFPPGDAREDWTIIRAVSGAVGKSIGFDTLAELREALCADHPHFAHADEIAPAKWASFGGRAKLSAEPVGQAFDNFYMTCAISRASETMAECVRASSGYHGAAVAAE